MTCEECEELIASTARDGRTLETAAEHLADCGACREFAKQTAPIAHILASWEAPAPAGPEAVATRAALVERLASRQRLPTTHQRRRSLARLIEQPALLAVAGAAAAAAGLAVAPNWVRVAAACWAGVAALLASLVLIHHAHRAIGEGEP